VPEVALTMLAGVAATGGNCTAEALRHAAPSSAIPERLTNRIVLVEVIVRQNMPFLSRRWWSAKRNCSPAAVRVALTRNAFLDDPITDMRGRIGTGRRVGWSGAGLPAAHAANNSRQATRLGRSSLTLCYAAWRLVRYPCTISCVENATLPFFQHWIRAVSRAKTPNPQLRLARPQ